MAQRKKTSSNRRKSTSAGKRPYRVSEQNTPPSEGRILAQRLGWLTLGALWVFLAAGLVTFNAGDPPSHAVWPPNATTHNITGPIGAHISYHLLRTMGIAVIIPMVFAAVLITRRAIRKPVTQPLVRAIGVVVLTASVAAILKVLAPNAGPMPGLSGGTIGLVAAAEMLPRFAMAGTLVWLLLLFLVGAIVACDKLVFALPMMLWRALVPAAGAVAAASKHASQHAPALAESVATRANAATDRAALQASQSTRKTTGLLAGLRNLLRREPAPVLMRPNDIDEELVEVKPDAGARDAARANARAAKPRQVVRPVPQPIDEDEEEALPDAPQVFDRDKLREKIQALPVRFGQANKSVATDEDLSEFQNAQNLEGYKFPTLDILEEPEEGFNEKLESLVREQAENLEASLRQYKINGEVVDIESGPAITLYHIRLAPGTKVSAINAIESDLARSLKAVNIRVVANMEGRDTVGVEVPNPTKERVRLKELMSNRDRFSKMKLPMFLGKDAGGEPLIADLTKMPHMLIAGTTGSGKSVCMNTIIMSFLYTKKPNELKLVLVDPKMVEMSQFKDIPHLMCPVVTEMSKAAAILEWAVTKMDERYEILAEAGCRDISGYNEMEWDEIKEAFGFETDEQAARIPRKLPYMVFIIDELADLMMTNKEVEGSIIRIAQKARAVGIHLILATQRPQANVVTGLIKSNMPCRISFKVASGMDSRIVLDSKGGELLLGQGDMLFLSPSSHKLDRCQGTLVDDKEIRKVVRHLRDIAAPSFERSLMQMRGPAGSDEDRILQSQNNSSASLEAAQEDPMFDRAVEIVLETGRGSVSLLQRRLAIGYTRASRLIDLMGIAGIIGAHKGSVAREILINIEEWREMQRLASEELERRKATDPDDPHQEVMFEVAPETEATTATLDPSDSAEGYEESAPFATDDEPAVEVHASVVDEPLDDGDEPQAETLDENEPLLETAELEEDSLEEDELEAPEDELEEDDLDEEEEPEAEYELTDEELEDEAQGDEDDEEDDEALDEEEEEDPEAEYEEDEEADEDEEPEDELEEDDEVEDAEEEDLEEEDEEELEYEYVDEDGNPIDPSELEDYAVDGEEDDEEEDAEYEEDEYEEDEYEEDEEEAAEPVQTRKRGRNGSAA